MTLPVSKPEIYLDAIVTTIKDHFGAELKTVKTHGGRFTPDELSRLHAQAPAVYVALVKLPRPDSPLAKTERLAHVAIAVVAKSRAGVTRDSLAIRISTELTRLIAGNNWGINGVLGVNAISDINNIYSATIDKKGIAMWTLSFQQLIQI